MDANEKPNKVLVICARRYNGHELWLLLGRLTHHAIPFEVVSTDHKICDELTLRPNVTKRLVYDVKLEELGTVFDGLCVVSGNMADTEAYWKDAHVQALVKQSGELGLPTAAICCSVPTLAPIAKGYRVSFYPLIRSKVRLLDAGAIPSGVAVSRDRNLVTAEHQMATEMWANEFCNLYLNGVESPAIYDLRKSNFEPKGRERRYKPDMQRAINAANKRNPR